MWKSSECGAFGWGQVGATFLAETTVLPKSMS